jgi:hypothetical protein
MTLDERRLFIKKAQSIKVTTQGDLITFYYDELIEAIENYVKTKQDD